MCAGAVRGAKRSATLTRAERLAQELKGMTPEERARAVACVLAVLKSLLDKGAT